jgi:hypothetical protein
MHLQQLYVTIFFPDHAAKTGNSRRRPILIGTIVTGAIILLLIFLLTVIIQWRKVLREDTLGTLVTQL